MPQYYATISRELGCLSWQAGYPFDMWRLFGPAGRGEAEIFTSMRSAFLKASQASSAEERVFSSFTHQGGLLKAQFRPSESEFEGGFAGQALGTRPAEAGASLGLSDQGLFVDQGQPLGVIVELFTLDRFAPRGSRLNLAAIAALEQDQTAELLAAIREAN